jgi:hypothetical protein
LAIVDSPLFGDEARGRIKNTLVFFKRFSNLGYDDEDPGERYIVNSLRAYKQRHSPLREEWKDFFSEQVAAWYALTQEEKEAYIPLATGLQTPYNAFLQEVLNLTPPPECPPEWWPYEPSIQVLSPDLTFSLTSFKPDSISISEIFEIPAEQPPPPLSPTLTKTFSVL